MSRSSCAFSKNQVLREEIISQFYLKKESNNNKSSGVKTL
jgi:hypothetical protein